MGASGPRSQAPALDFTTTSKKTMNNQIFGTTLLLISIVVPQSLYANGGDTFSEGAQLFKKYCAVCHGENAIGQDPTQPAGGWDAEETRLAPALNGAGHAWHHPPTLLFDYIQKGSIDETSPMPSFGAVLSETQTKEVIAYFQSLWPDNIKSQYKARFPETID